MPPYWENVICVASGPSLTTADCDWACASGWPVIAVNSSWQALPGCDVIFAGDWSWWQRHHDHIDIPAERWTVSRTAVSRLGISHFTSRLMRPTWNSGQVAIEFAVSRGARQVLLLGYDCSVAQGSHWHGDHVGLKNPDNRVTARWRTEFQRLRQVYPDVTIMNCSRETALTCFPRLSPEEALTIAGKVRCGCGDGRMPRQPG